MSKKFNGKVSRRSFLKATAAMGAMGALSACSTNSSSDSGSSLLLPEKPKVIPYVADDVYTGMCRANCWENCRLNIHVRNGKVTSTSMAPMKGTSEAFNTDYNRACLKGLSHVQRIYHKDRITSPLKRKAGTLRGANQWETISWEQAFKEVGEKFANIINDKSLNPVEFGGRSIGVITGSGNYGSIHGIFGYGQKFGISLGATSIQPALDNAGPMGMSKIMGKKTYNFMHNNEPAGMQDSDVIITWGSNISESQIQTWHFISEAQEKRGAKLVSIDVRYNTTASKADHFVHVVPGSDAILAIHMLKYMMDNFGDEQYVNRNFLVKNTTAPFLVYVDKSNHENTSSAINPEGFILPEDSFTFVKDVNGMLIAIENDGLDTQISATDSVELIVKNAAGVITDKKHALDYTKDYILEHNGSYSYVDSNGDTRQVKTAYQVLKEHILDQCMKYPLESHTGVTQGVMKEVVDLYAKANTATIYTGYGIDHYTNGHHTTQAIAIISALAGKIGKEGCGTGYFVPMTPFMNYMAWFDFVNPKPLSGKAGIPFMAFPTVYNSKFGLKYDKNDPNGKYGRHKKDLNDFIVTGDTEKIGGVDELYYRGAGGLQDAEELVPTKVRGLYVFSCNPLSSWVDQNVWLNNSEDAPGMLVELNNGSLHKATSGGDIDYKMRTVVVSEMSMTDTALYADYVLPAAHWFEVEDFNGFSTHPYMFYQEKAVAPLGKCKSDLEILIGLSHGIADADSTGTLSYLRAHFPKVTTMDENDAVYQKYLDAVLANDSYKIWYKGMTGEEYTGPEVSFKNLKKEKVMRYLPGSNTEKYIYPPFRRDDDLFFQGTASMTGRIEIFAEKLLHGVSSDFGQQTRAWKNNNVEYQGLTSYDTHKIMQFERMPTWEPPTEIEVLDTSVSSYPLRDTDGSMVFSYMQEHTRWRVHTQWYNVPWLREIDPEATIELSPEDAQALGGIKSGDMIEVYNRRGVARGKAVISRALRPGVVNMPKGWQRLESYKEPGDYAAGNATSYQEPTSIAMHVVSVNQSYFDVQVKVRKVQG